MSSYIDQLVEQLMLPKTSNSISYINSFQLKKLAFQLFYQTNPMLNSCISIGTKLKLSLTCIPQKSNNNKT